VLGSILLFSLLLQGKAASRPEPQQKPAKPDVVNVDPTAPPTEPEPAPVVYTLDPDKAAKEVRVGSFHMKRHNWNAAVARFQEAVKWNPKQAEAWLRLGEAREKNGESTKALEAYRKYLELAPNDKKAREARKAVARLERELK
jgi:tetratricopeptide (TPR) repeat protein